VSWLAILVFAAAVLAWHIWRRRRHDWLQEVAAASRDALALVDERGRILSWNEAAERIYGYTRREVTGQPFVSFLVPELRERAARNFLQLRHLPSGEVTIESECLHRDGRRVPVEIVARGVVRRGTWRAVAVVRDLSSQKQREEEMRCARERAEEMAAELSAVNQAMEQATVWANEMAAQAAMANAAKSEFLASMSHEIRTPMNGVLGMLSLLEQTELTADQRDCVETIRYSGQTLLDIINRILDFSRIESGKLELEPAEFDLRQEIERAVALFGDRAEAKAIELIDTVADDAPANVIADQGRFRQVIVNLLGNAMKFTSEGEVAVEAGLASREGDRAVIWVSVRDTGIGMSKEVAARLFQPFYQGDSSVRKRFGGTGLGLAISRRLVEAMGGKLEVESAKGRGSRFRFTIAAGIGAEASREATALPAEIRGARLLVAHANATMRQAIAQHAAAWGFAVKAVDGAAAAEAVREGGWRVVVADAGDASVEALREAAPPALVLLIPQSQSQRVAAFGASACVAKPVRWPRLREALSTAVGAEAPQSLSCLAQAAAQPAPGAAAAADHRILIVEDNAVNQKVARRLLEKLGYAADVVDDGAPAVTAAATGRYSAILMDCQMPGLDGFQATQRIRRLEGEARTTPVIAMTANAMKGDREKCLAAGMSDYVAKPVDLAALKAALERWCGQRHRASPCAAEEPAWTP
jgi:two-component system sensor histidine kinase/response regulator